MKSSRNIEGYEVPLYSALTQPPLFAGVPREFGIITLVVTLVVTLGLNMWWIGAIGGSALYALAAVLTRQDSCWLLVFRNHLKQPSYLDW